MKSLLFLLLPAAAGLPTRTLGQQAPAATDLRRLAEAMQEAAKPGVTQEQRRLAAARALPAPPPTGPVRLVSRSALPGMPLPLLLNNRPILFDSLNYYTLAQVATVTLDTDPHYNALLGGRSSWGVIRVQLKPATNRPAIK